VSRAVEDDDDQVLDVAPERAGDRLQFVSTGASMSIARLADGPTMIFSM